jgi:hypothetical protein
MVPDHMVRGTELLDGCMGGGATRPTSLDRRYTAPPAPRVISGPLERECHLPACSGSTEIDLSDGVTNRHFSLDRRVAGQGGMSDGSEGIDPTSTAQLHRYSQCQPRLW